MHDLHSRTSLREKNCLATVCMPDYSKETIWSLPGVQHHRYQPEKSSGPLSLQSLLWSTLCLIESEWWHLPFLILLGMLTLLYSCFCKRVDLQNTSRYQKYLYQKVPEAYQKLPAGFALPRSYKAQFDSKVSWCDVILTYSVY